MNASATVSQPLGRVSHIHLMPERGVDVRSFRILHVDDDPEVRDVVELLLGDDPILTVKSSACADEALAIAAEWAPDLIMSDAMMPGTDGPDLLVRLRKGASTAAIPVIFMTALSRPHEVEELKLRGAFAVIAKPFDRATLAETMRRHLRAIKLAAADRDFALRLRADAAALAVFRRHLRHQSDSSVVPEGLLSCVHKLAGSAGVFNFKTVSRMASTLEDAIIERGAGRGAAGRVEADLDALLESIARA